MKLLMLATLFFSSVVHAGVYLDLHADSYEVLLNSVNCNVQEKKYWGIRYEQLVLKDKLLHLLKEYDTSAKNKIEEIERVVYEIDQKDVYLDKLSDEIIDRNPDFVYLLMSSSYREDYDFENILFKIKGWNQISGKLYYRIIRHTTINTTYAI